MSDSRTPRERLDALLAGLEDGVLRPDQAGQRLADEGVAAEDVRAMRSAIESLIHARAGGPERRQEPLRGDGDGASGAKARVAQVMERLGRWVGVVQDEGAGGAAPEVRMAFSGEPSEKAGKTARKATRRQPGGSDGAGHKDR